MKLKSALLFVLLFAVALPAMAQSSLSTEAQRAYMSGDLETAKAKFKSILAQDPENVVAINYLKVIEVAEGVSKGPSKQYQKLIVPQVEFKDATLSSVLDFLKVEAAKLSDGKLQPNFVLNPGADRDATVTMNLRNVPFTEVLHFVGELANVKFSFEQYAIVVKPKSEK